MLGTLMLVLFLCLFATVPIALSLGISTLGVFATQFPSMPMANNLAQAMITSADSFPLMAIPFFMLVGTLMEKTGIARRLVDVARHSDRRHARRPGYGGDRGLHVLCGDFRFRPRDGGGDRRHHASGYDRAGGIPARTASALSPARRSSVRLFRLPFR